MRSIISRFLIPYKMTEVRMPAQPHIKFSFLNVFQNPVFYILVNVFPVKFIQYFMPVRFI